MNLQIYGAIPDFNRKISTVRSRGIALIPITQNKGQLDNRYPNGLSDEIIGNCDLRLGLGTTDTLTAEFFCDLVGVSTVQTESIRKEAGIEGEFEFGQKNISTLQRNLLNKDEILRISATKLFVILRGIKQLLLDKLIFTEIQLAYIFRDCSFSKYTPKWTKNLPQKVQVNKKKENIEEIPIKKPKIDWDTF